MSKKTYPFTIEYEQMGDKRWVKVGFDSGHHWIPKLIDLADILEKIGVCEDEKYGFPKRKIKGAEMVSEFIKEAIDLGIDGRKELEKLCDKYEIPKR